MNIFKTLSSYVPRIWVIGIICGIFLLAFHQIDNHKSKIYEKRKKAEELHRLEILKSKREKA